jgi:hypothetical protein
LQVAGLSATPKSKREIELGLDRLAIANGGRLAEVAEVFQTGTLYATGHAEQHPAMLRGMIDGLGNRLLRAVALDVGGERRAVLQAASALDIARWGRSWPCCGLMAGTRSHRSHLMAHQLDTSDSDDDHRTSKRKNAGAHQESLQP